MINQEGTFTIKIFNVKVITGLDLCSKPELDRMRIKLGQNLYYCD